jgi:tetratricopeptide (TPR) repeat protein
LSHPKDNAADAALALAIGRVQQLAVAGRAVEAERMCRVLVHDHPAAPAALNALALLVKGRGELAEAEELLHRALAAAPRDAGLHNNLGNVLRRRNDLVGAEKAYRRALALNPSHTDAYYNLGVVLHDLGRDDEALAALRRALALRPGYADALAQIAALEIAKEQYTDAIRSADEALRSNPGHFGAIYNRGVALMELEHFDESIGDLRRALSLRSNSVEANFALGNALARSHREDEALEAYRTAAELAPAFLQAHYHYSALAWTMGHVDRVYASYAHARARIGDNADLLVAEGVLRLRLNDASTAEELARRACAAAPERRDAADLLAQSLAAQRRFDECIPVLEASVEAEPGQVVHRRELGIVLLQSGQPEAAVRMLEDALRMAPSDQLLLAHLALAYRQSGNGRFGEFMDFVRHVRVYEIPAPEGVDGTEGFNRVLSDELQGLHTQRAEPFDQTLRGGTQTMGELFTSGLPAVTMLRERIREAVADYIRSLPAGSEDPFLSRRCEKFDFAGSWSCRLKSSGYHTNHVHPKGWISSAYYVSLPGVVSRGEGEQGWLKFGESNLALGDCDRPSRLVQPSIGKLVLFPSYYWHGTVPFTDDAARLTVAFDVVPRP